MASSFSSSHFIKTVCLNDWWLIKAECYSEGDRIAVAGIASAGRQGPKRMFSSAPIIKRYDLFTLETADGVCVMLSGYINKLRTIENGFSSEVFSHFVIGFPQDWKKCAEKRFGQFLAAEVLSKCNADSEPTVVTRTGNASPTLNRHFRKDESPSKEVIMDVPDNGRDLLLSAKLEFQDDGRMQSLKEDGFSHAVGNMQCHVSRSKPIVVREKRNASPTLKHPFLKDASLTNKVTMDRRDNDIHMLFKANLRLEDHRKIRSLKAKGNFEGMKKCSSSLLEAVTVKRSRSGRLLLPALEFWRNQLPIYDADHGLSAIKDGTAIVKLRNGWWRGEDGSLSVAHRKYKKG